MIHYSSWGSLYLSERARERQPEGGSAAQAEGRAPTEVTTEPTTALLIFPPSLPPLVPLPGRRGRLLLSVPPRSPSRVDDRLDERRCSLLNGLNLSFLKERLSIS